MEVPIGLIQMYRKRLYNLIRKPLGEPLDRVDVKRLARKLVAMSDDRRERYLYYVRRLPRPERLAILSAIELVKPEEAVTI